MPVLAVRLGFACCVAALCLGQPPAHAQSASSYWMPGWIGFGGNLEAGQDADGNSSNRAAGAFSSTRFNFSDGWFVGNERSAMGLGMTGFNQVGAFGSRYSEGVQFGYNLKNAPVTFFAGFDSLKTNSGFGSLTSPFDSTSGTVPGYAAHAGVEFRPASNLSLSLGVGYVQSGRVDTDSKSPSLSNASQFDLVSGHR